MSFSPFYIVDAIGGGGELDPSWNIWIHLGKSATKQTLEPTQKRPSDPECMNEIGSLYTQEMNYL